MLSFKDYGIKYLARMNKEGNEADVLLFAFIKGLLERVGKNKDAVVIVTGERGEGKTTFSVLCSMLGTAIPETQEFGHLQKMNFEWNNIIRKYTSESQKRLTSTRFQFFVCDEIIDIAFSPDALTRKTKFFSKVFSKTRKLNNIYFLCIPFFKRITGFFRDVAHFWVHIVYQKQNKNRDDWYAYAYIFTKNKDPTTDDPWMFDSLRKSFKVGKRHLLSRLKSHAGFLAEVRFKPLPEALEHKYEELSRREGLESIEFEDEKPKGKIKIERIEKFKKESRKQAENIWKQDL